MMAGNLLKPENNTCNNISKKIPNASGISQYLTKIQMKLISILKKLHSSTNL